MKNFKNILWVSSKNAKNQMKNFQNAKHPNKELPKMHKMFLAYA
jgi:hypothetical protein